MWKLKGPWSQRPGLHFHKFLFKKSKEIHFMRRKQLYKVLFARRTSWEIQEQGHKARMSFAQSMWLKDGGQIRGFEVDWWNNNHISMANKAKWVQNHGESRHYASHTFPRFHTVHWWLRETSRGIHKDFFRPKGDGGKSCKEFCWLIWSWGAW